MTHNRELFNEMTANGYETTNLIVSDGLINLHSDNSGQDLSITIESMLDDYMPQIKDHFKTLYHTEKEMQFVYKLDVELANNDNDETVDEVIFVVGKHTTTIHQHYINTLFACHTSEFRAMPGFENVQV